MAALSKLSSRLRKWLDAASNGDKAGNPLGVEAASVALGTRLNEIATLRFGQATVLDGNTSVTVSLGSDFADGGAVVSFAEAPTAATVVWADDIDAAGDLVINIDQDNTADLVICYFVDAR